MTNNILVGHIYECNCSCGLIGEIVKVSNSSVEIKSLTKCGIAEKNEVFTESLSVVHNKLYYSEKHNSKLARALK